MVHSARWVVGEKRGKEENKSLISEQPQKNDSEHEHQHTHVCCEHWFSKACVQSFQNTLNEKFGGFSNLVQ